jgi:hypothetical protein
MHIPVVAVAAAQVVRTSDTESSGTAGVGSLAQTTQKLFSHLIMVMSYKSVYLLLLDGAGT